MKEEVNTDNNKLPHMRDAELFAECLYHCLLMQVAINKGQIDVIADMLLRSSICIDA